jgi:hypothetical protein
VASLLYALEKHHYIVAIRLISRVKRTNLGFFGYANQFESWLHISNVRYNIHAR